VTEEPTTGKAPGDVADLEVWEYEGGHLDREASRPAVAQPPTPGSDGDGVDATAWVAAAQLADLTPDSALHVDLAGHPICLTRSAGAVQALLDECSHGQVALSDGDVQDGYVECWLHGSRFDLTTGVPAGPPATVPVPVYAVRITHGVIEVALPAPASDTDIAAQE